MFINTEGGTVVEIPDLIRTDAVMRALRHATELNHRHEGHATPQADASWLPFFTAHFLGTLAEEVGAVPMRRELPAGPKTAAEPARRVPTKAGRRQQRRQAARKRTGKAR